MSNDSFVVGANSKSTAISYVNYLEKVVTNGGVVGVSETSNTSRSERDITSYVSSSETMFDVYVYYDKDDIDEKSPIVSVKWGSYTKYSSIVGSVRINEIGILVPKPEDYKAGSSNVYIYYDMLNNEVIYSTELYKWNSPSSYTDLCETLAESVESSLYSTILENYNTASILFLLGVYLSKESCILKTGTYEQGVSWDFGNTPSFYVYKDKLTAISKYSTGLFVKGKHVTGIEDLPRNIYREIEWSNDISIPKRDTYLYLDSVLRKYHVTTDSDSMAYHWTYCCSWIASVNSIRTVQPKKHHYVTGSLGSVGVVVDVKSNTLYYVGAGGSTLNLNGVSYSFDGTFTSSDGYLLFPIGTVTKSSCVVCSVATISTPSIEDVYVDDDTTKKSYDDVSKCAAKVKRIEGQITAGYYCMSYYETKNAMAYEAFNETCVATNDLHTATEKKEEIINSKISVEDTRYSKVMDAYNTKLDMALTELSTLKKTDEDYIAKLKEVSELEDSISKEAEEHSVTINKLNDQLIGLLADYKDENMSYLNKINAACNKLQSAMSSYASIERSIQNDIESKESSLESAYNALFSAEKAYYGQTKTIPNVGNAYVILPINDAYKQSKNCIYIPIYTVSYINNTYIVRSVSSGPSGAGVYLCGISED